MFQDTLLIIKPDYLTKRKPLLLFLLREGFLIKGQRKTYFTPELAAEFYKDRARDPSFMFHVILLSKGNSEAFIVAKECAVKELVNVMVCYFGSSTEMERNIHVTQCPNKVQAEISFIFPNYIFDPITCPEEIKFCVKNPLVESTIMSMYDIATNSENDPDKNWKIKLAESLISKNKALPLISNQCSHLLRFNMQNIAQQTKITCLKHEKTNENATGLLSTDQSKECSSLNLTSSSCITCSSFGSDAECIRQTYQPTLGEIVKARTAPLNIPESSSSSTNHTLQENLGEDLNTEENVIPKDFSVFVVDQVFYDFQKKKEVRIGQEETELNIKDDALNEANSEIRVEKEEEQTNFQDAGFLEEHTEVEIEKKMKEADVEDDDLSADNIPRPDEPELNVKYISNIDESAPASPLPVDEGGMQINKESFPLSDEVIAVGETIQ